MKSLMVFKRDGKDGQMVIFHDVKCVVKRIDPLDLAEHEKKGWKTDHKEFAVKDKDKDKGK